MTRVVSLENGAKENNEYKQSKEKICFRNKARVKSYDGVRIFQLIVDNVATVRTQLLLTSMLEKGFSETL